MSCISACSPSITKWTIEGCNITTRPGGMLAFGVMLCDASFSDVSGGSITDVATWEQLITDEKIFVSGKIIGSKAKGSPTTLRVASCLPEVVVGKTTTISIRDYNSDNTSFDDYAFYRDIETNYARLKFFYITCDELVYFYEDGEWSAQIDDVREETKEQPAYFDFVATATPSAMVVPTKVVGISDII